MRRGRAGAGPPPGAQTATIGQVLIWSTGGRCAQLCVGDDSGGAGGPGRGAAGAGGGRCAGGGG
jgi:hypothetical protein